MPAVGVLVLELFLNPLKDLMEGLVFNLAVGQICRLNLFLLSFTPTLLLA